MLDLTNVSESNSFIELLCHAVRKSLKLTCNVLQLNSETNLSDLVHVVAANSEPEQVQDDPTVVEELKNKISRLTSMRHARSETLDTLDSSLLSNHGVNINSNELAYSVLYQNEYAAADPLNGESSDNFRSPSRLNLRSPASFEKKYANVNEKSVVSRDDYLYGNSEDEVIEVVNGNEGDEDSIDEPRSGGSLSTDFPSVARRNSNSNFIVESPTSPNDDLDSNAMREASSRSIASPSAKAVRFGKLSSPKSSFSRETFAEYSSASISHFEELSTINEGEEVQQAHALEVVQSNVSLGPLFSNVVILQNLNLASHYLQMVIAETIRFGSLSANSKVYKLASPCLFILTYSDNENFSFPPPLIEPFALNVVVQNEMIRGLFGLLDLPEFEFNISEALQLFRNEISTVHMRHSLAGYLRDIVIAIRQHPRVAIGPSLLTSQSLQKFASVHALLCGIRYIRPVDIDSLAVDCLSHKVLMRRKSTMASRRHLISHIVFQLISVPK